jgi:hypothetical protein
MHGGYGWHQVLKRTGLVVLPFPRSWQLSSDDNHRLIPATRSVMIVRSWDNSGRDVRGWSSSGNLFPMLTKSDNACVSRCLAEVRVAEGTRRGHVLACIAHDARGTRGIGDLARHPGARTVGARLVRDDDVVPPAVLEGLLLNEILRE